MIKEDSVMQEKVIGGLNLNENFSLRDNETCFSIVMGLVHILSFSGLSYEFII